jgi:putative phage-type endonuclease
MAETNDFFSYLDELVKEKSKNILTISEPNYLQQIYKDVVNNCNYFMKPEDIKTEFDKNIQEILIKHDYIRSEIWTLTTITVDPAWIDYLSNVKQPEQKSPEWYAFRHDHITASSAFKAFGTQSAKNSLIYEKCMPMVKRGSGLSENSLTWGHKYEPLTTMIYEQRMNTTVKEFGCIEHAQYPFLAASPDGIVVGQNYGRMLEIKNVVSREIDGNPKKEYYIQMQLQMEVCDLDECDFVETKFVEYTYEEYMQDGGTKGIILVFVQENTYVYKHMPQNITDSVNIDQWMNDIMQITPGWFKNIYWRLDVFSCVLVKRNRRWFEAAIPILQELWYTICSERQTGEYMKRAPKSKK